MRKTLNIKDYMRGNVLIVPQDISIVPLKKTIFQKQQSNTQPTGDEEKEEKKNTSLVEVPEGFITKDFRGLSETLVWNYWGLFDYGVPGVLKKSVELFPDKLSLFKDHWWSVDSIIGYTTNFRYSEIKNGLSGIDSTLCVDSQVDSKIARNVETGAANRCSYTLLEAIEQSHKMSFDDFYDAMGIEVEGEIVRWLVTEIIEWLELSLVWYGADSSAKALEEKLEHYKSISKNTFYLGGISHSTPSREEKEVNMDPEIQAIISMMKEAGKECATLTQVKDAITTIITENTTLKGQVNTLEGQVKTLQPQKELNEKVMTDLRAEVEKFTRLTRGTGDNKVLGDMEKQLIQNATYDQLTKWKEEREKEYEKIIPPLTCATCGSTNISHRSSIEVPPEAQVEEKVTLKPLSI
jgi:hypothetical protein